MVGSTERAVALAAVNKVMAPSCKAVDPVGAAAGETTVEPDGEPAYIKGGGGGGGKRPWAGAHLKAPR